MQVVNKGVHRKQETRIHQISLLMKYSFANEGQILDSYAFEGISKIVGISTIRDPESGFPMAIPSIVNKDSLFIKFLLQMTNGGSLYMIVYRIRSSQCEIIF